MRRVLGIAASALVLLVAGCGLVPARQAGKEPARPVETARPGACCPHDEEGPVPGMLALRVQGGLPEIYSRRPDAWPEPVVVHPGDEIEVELGSEVPDRLWPNLALGLDGGEPWQGTQPLARFDAHGEARFIVPPDLEPGEYRLVLGDPTFAVNSALCHLILRVAAVPDPEVQASPAGLAALLGGAVRVVLVARDLPGVSRDLDAARLESFRVAMGALGPEAAGTWPPAYPDYALYVYTGEPSQVRPAIIQLSDPEHLVALAGGVRLAGASRLWELARAALEPPPPVEGDPYGLLRATRVKVLFAGEAPIIHDLAGGPESAGRVAGLARAILSGILNNICEPQGEARVTLTFTVMGREQEVRVMEDAQCAPVPAAVVLPAGGLHSGIYWREGLLDLIRLLTGR